MQVIPTRLCWLCVQICKFFTVLCVISSCRTFEGFWPWLMLSMPIIPLKALILQELYFHLNRSLRTWCNIELAENSVTCVGNAKVSAQVMAHNLFGFGRGVCQTRCIMCLLVSQMDCMRVLQLVEMFTLGLPSQTMSCASTIFLR
jgi:hypothetical protein